jgi:hypothetical protein
MIPNPASTWRWWRLPKILDKPEYMIDLIPKTKNEYVYIFPTLLTLELQLQSSNTFSSLSQVSLKDRATAVLSLSTLAHAHPYTRTITHSLMTGQLSFQTHLQDRTTPESLLSLRTHSDMGIHVVGKFFGFPGEKKLPQSNDMWYERET